MRLLLFFVSSLFSFIFYSFYNLNNWKTILWNDRYAIELESIFNYLGLETWISLLFLSVLFLTIAITFVIYFSPLKISENTNKYKIDKSILYYSLFYILLITPLYFGFFNYDLLIIFFIILFIIWDFSFNHLPKLPFLKKYELDLKYFWLILNYLIWISSLFYIYIIEFSYYLFFIVLFLIFFNYQVHKNYINYISLVYSLFIATLLFLYFILKIIDLYILLF